MPRMFSLQKNIVTFLYVWWLFCLNSSLGTGKGTVFYYMLRHMLIHDQLLFLFLPSF